MTTYQALDQTFGLSQQHLGARQVESVTRNISQTVNAMFGALNRFISRLDSDSPSRDADGHGAFGFQVLRNKNVDIPIEPWYDFIIGINGRQIVCRLRRTSHSGLQAYRDPG